MIALMGLGYRNEAISILGKEVMQPRGLIGLGQNSIESSGAELQQILKMFADKENYPILVHCKSGKDRTGLVTILLLLLLVRPLSQFSANYYILRMMVLISCRMSHSAPLLRTMSRAKAN